MEVNGIVTSVRPIGCATFFLTIDAGGKDGCKQKRLAGEHMLLVCSRYLCGLLEKMGQTGVIRQSNYNVSTGQYGPKPKKWLVCVGGLTFPSICV